MAMAMEKFVTDEGRYYLKVAFAGLSGEDNVKIGQLKAALEAIRLTKAAAKDRDSLRREHLLNFAAILIDPDKPDDKYRDAAIVAAALFMKTADKDGKRLYSEGFSRLIEELKGLSHQVIVVFK